MPILTEVSELAVEHDYARLTLISTSRMHGGEKERNTHYRLNLTNPFACCGMRALSNMSVLAPKVCPEYGSVEMLTLIANALRRVFNGGNVSFVLNAYQRKQLKQVLLNMDTIGQGLSEPMRFRNFNMWNYNYLYVWTYSGRKGRTADERDMVV